MNMSLGRQKRNHTDNASRHRRKAALPFGVLLILSANHESDFPRIFPYSVTFVCPEAVLALTRGSYIASHLTAGRMYSPW